MSYKFKSLLYFTCFVASALVYYNMEQSVEPNKVNKMMGMVDADSADHHVNEIVLSETHTY